LRTGLKEAGFIEGENVAVEFHYADNHPERLSALIGDLVRRPVSVIVGNNDTAHAAKAATTRVPIVFVTGGDPIQQGLVASLNRPSGNATGVSFLVTALGGKRLELLHQLAPKATTIAALVHRGSPQVEVERNDLLLAAQAIGLRLLVFEVGSASDIDAAFATASQSGADALFIGVGGFLNSHRDQLLELAARQRLPSSFVWRDFVAAGGLMSYGSSPYDAYRQAGGYVARILKGEKPGEVPVIQSTKFEFVLNLKTAKALGLQISDRVLALTDEVID
jgi:putative ABC transport system substrate-binding protein